MQCTMGNVGVILCGITRPSCIVIGCICYDMIRNARAQIEEIQTEIGLKAFILKTLSPSIPLMYICFVPCFMKQLFRVQF